MHRNASTYLSMVAAKRFGFDRSIYYDVVGWNGLAIVPDEDKNRIAILHLAEMVDFYSRGMVDFYQIDRYALKLFDIIDENQFNKLSTTLIDGYKKEYGEN